MSRMQLICVALSIGLIGPASRGDVADRVAELTAQVVKLTAEIEALKAENAELKQRLAEKEKGGAGKTEVATTTPTFALGEMAKLGAYQYRVPDGWTYQ